MARLGLESEIVDEHVVARSAARLGRAGVMLPTFSQLAEPQTIPQETRAALATIDPDAADPHNLFRVHWFNDAQRTDQQRVPAHLVIPKALSGVEAPIIVALGQTFPMIAAHKVLAAYGCLVPRLVTGQFDPAANKAIWPSTGNYCRGGVAISRILGCRGVAVLPEGMSQERFSWLERWVSDPADIVRTPGSESNVKEIYDACAELDADPRHIVFNQFCEFGNHLVHWLCTGRALGALFDSVAADASARDGKRLALHSFVSATGSAGTIAAGDQLKEAFGARIAAVEAVECPTLLYNGFGEHNIQGIGDKHLPLIHNALNTDLVVGVSDRTTDSLALLFNSGAGRDYLARRHQLPRPLLEALPGLGLSGLANVVAAIKLARYYELDGEQAIVTVATDGAALYSSELAKAETKHFNGTFDQLAAAESWGEHLRGIATDHVIEQGQRDRQRVFNLGYYTWVEQQGVSLEQFEARRRPDFWRELRTLIPRWDALITEFNARAQTT